MFFFISKTIPQLFYPVPVLFFGLIAVLVFYRRRYTRRILLALIVFFYSISIPFTSNLLLGWIKLPQAEQAKLRPPYDVVVVLSGMVNLKLSREGYIEYSDAVDRILAGISLVRQGKAEKLLISGGTGSLLDQSIKEADLLKRQALELGLDPGRIIIERDSRNTHENALYSARIIRGRGYRRILLVTSAFHMRRALACFRKQGISPDVLPVDYRSSSGISVFSFYPSFTGLLNIQIALREMAGLIAYKLRGYI